MHSSRWLTSVVGLIFCLVVTSCKEEKKYLFENLPSSHTGIDFENKLEDKELFNILYYLYYYNGGGVATGDINNDGLPDLYFTANSKGNNKLYLNKGDFKFEDISKSAGVTGMADWATGVTMTDVNGDGFLDIYVTVSSQHHNLTGHNELYINNQNNTFTESAEKYGLNFSAMGTQAAFFDYDHDGDLDVYILNHSQKPNANITDTSARRKPSDVSGDRLLRNDITTTGKFTDVSVEAGIYQSSLGYGLGIAIADLNQDGWDDIYVGNDFHENDYYYINTGNGKFIESGQQHFRHYSRFSMGNDINDFNNDGHPDIITVDMLPPDEKVLKTYGSDENADTYKFKLTRHGYQHQYSKNCLQVNNGKAESFSETALLSGVAATDWSWAPLFADFDNDGNKDLFISSGIVKRPVDMDYVRFVSDLVAKTDEKNLSELDTKAINEMPDGASHPYFYKGNGNLRFDDVSEQWGTAHLKGYFNGAAYADLNNDGRLDVVINSLNSNAVILKNNHPEKYTLELNLKGKDGNRFGIGAKVWLFYNGKMQYQQLALTRGFQSSVEPVLHFGIDSLRYIDSLLIVWPSQKFQLVRNVPAKGDLEFQEMHAGGQFNYDQFFPREQSPLQDITSQQGINWKHTENNFFDQNKQYLIPHQLSTSGPAMAVGDVNLDGLDDFYMGGASGQTGQLFVQLAKGKFRAATGSDFSEAIACDETAAVFFDANKDRYPDLYVVSGGNEMDNNHPALADHLYINDGKGNFRIVKDAIPPILRNKSCVQAADIDNDGDMDLFVGGLSDARIYGIPQSSYLLLNDGSGKFSTAAASIINLDTIGMVTAAAFSDLNKDSWPDLIVTGEWMPLKIFINKNGKLSPIDIPTSTGLWQSITIADVNRDGNPDILAGNWGLNNKFYAGKDGPVKLYIKDFDKNGSTEQILTYSIKGEEYTFLAKDELERALPVLKKAYLKYSEVAGKSVQFMFYDLFNGYTEKKAEVLASSLFLNDGKGGFKRQDLPDQFQLSPVFSFISLDSSNWLAGGNFYGTIPYEGRYDAFQPSVLTFKGNDMLMFSDLMSGVSGEIRSMKWLKSGKADSILLVGRNNETPLFFKPAEQP
ncbi:VCBS repeat-containing protein [Flavihumibacter sp. UBA7668]|uniref:VCBS repeat-containing protein n=1 Tax=Flavihumibacter sp. UBA7668 TaxID=1946542 RepID=UPI0025C510FF|nr:VCBS repeat-containing protein [Flavihumibacter sp. UBA7668]